MSPKIIKKVAPYFDSKILQAMKELNMVQSLQIYIRKIMNTRCAYFTFLLPPWMCRAHAHYPTLLYKLYYFFNTLKKFPLFWKHTVEILGHFDQWFFVMGLYLHNFKKSPCI